MPPWMKKLQRPWPSPEHVRRNCRAPFRIRTIISAIRGSTVLYWDTTKAAWGTQVAHRLHRPAVLWRQAELADKSVQEAGTNLSGLDIAVGLGPVHGGEPAVGRRAQVGAGLLQLLDNFQMPVRGGEVQRDPPVTGIQYQHVNDTTELSAASQPLRNGADACMPSSQTPTRAWGAYLSSVRAWTEAPCDSSTLTTSMCPYSAASCSGVYPSESAASGSAPARNMRSAAAACPL